MTGIWNGYFEGVHDINRPIVTEDCHHIPIYIMDFINIFSVTSDSTLNRYVSENIFTETFLLSSVAATLHYFL